MACFTVSVGLGMAQKAPLQYDETVYATRARHWATGAPVSRDSFYRSPGLPAFGSLVLRIKDGDTALRAVGLMSGLTAVGALFYLGKTVAGDGAALLAAGAFAAAPSVQIRAGQFLGDLPAATLLFLATALVWRAIEKPGGEKALLGAVIFAAASFYVRYASVLTIVTLGISGLILARRRLKSLGRAFLLSGLVFFLLLVPHLIYSIVETGTPWGVVARANAAPAYARVYWGQGLVQYAKWLPNELAGRLAGGLVAVGLLVLLAMLAARFIPQARQWSDPRSRVFWFLAVPAVVQILVLGIAHHAEQRYLFFPVGLLALAASVTICPMVASRLTGKARVATAALFVGFALAAAPSVVIDRAHAAAISRRSLADAARAAGRMAVPPCGIVSRVGRPIVTWYSGCPAYQSLRALPKGGSGFLLVVLHLGNSPVSLPPEAGDARVDPSPVFITTSPSGTEALLYRLRSKG